MNVFILDDNIEVANNLAEEIEKIVPYYNIKCYNEINSFLLDISDTMPTIIFLDIVMPQISGIELSRSICTKKSNVAIIFYSGFPKENFDVYEGPHTYFLEKPFDSLKIKKAIDIAVAHLNDNFFKFTFARKTFAILFDDIAYLESTARIIKVVTKTETHQFYGSLDKVEKEYGKKFIRVNKSFLINPLFIKAKIGNSIVLQKIQNSNSNVIIQISRPYIQKVMEHELFAISD